MASADRYGEDWERPDASEWPLAVTERPLTLTRNMLELTGNTVRLDMSNSNFGEPISLAPELHFGVTNRLTLGIVHDTGVCVLGGCGYNDGGVAMRFRLYDHERFEIAGTGKVHGSLSVFGASVGFLMRLRMGEMAVVMAPSAYVGVRGDDENRSSGFDIPVHVQLQIGKRIMAYAATGLTNATFSEFGKNADVPFGVGASLTVSRHFDIGGELLIHNFVGPSQGKNTERTLSLRAALRI